MKKQIFISTFLAFSTVGFAQTWNLTGNGSTNPTSNYVGTSDNASLVFRTNATERMRILSTGYVGIGNASPTDHLHINSIGNNGLTITQGSYGAAAISLENTKPGGHKFHIGSNSADNGQGAGSFSIYDYTMAKDRFTIKDDGKIGIGSWSPSDQVHIFPAAGGHGITITQNQANYGSVLTLHNGNSGGRSFSMRSSGSGDPAGIGNFMVYDNAASLVRFFIKGSNGNVGIGTTNPTAGLTVNNNVLIGDPATVTLPSGYKLYVQTGILTEKVKVALTSTTDWADYVFEKDYKLNSLAEVKTYLEANKHLPGVPSAQELVEQGGIDLAKMDAKLMEKIEELTLYIIQLNEKNEQLSKRVEELEKGK